MSGRYPGRTLLVVALVAGAVALMPAPSHASPADEIRATKENAAQASRKLDDLAADLELRNEEYLEITDNIAATRALISATERDLDAATSDQDTARLLLRRRVVAMYRNGPFGFLEVLVGSADYRDLVTRLDLMRFIGRRDAATVMQLTDSRERIDAARRTLETRHLELITLRERAARKKSEVAAALQAQTQYLSRINERLDELIAEEKRRREEEAARRAALIAAQMRTPSRAGRPFDPTALGAAHPEAVTIARRYVDKTPYLWGGVTPAGFDCSGLVQYCYALIGINIPRTSRQQYRYGAFIPPDRLDLLHAGDLVFFGYDADPGKVHHVGMYIGDGLMIHAPQAGQDVAVASLLERIERRRDYVGATRPQ